MDEEDSGGGGEEGAPAWMATFSDMATLLLTFFILLLSFANMDVKQFRVALGSVKDAFGVRFDTEGQFEGLTTTPVELSDTASAATLEEAPKVKDRAVNKVKRFVKEQKLEKQVEVSGSPRGVVLRVKDALFFDTGSAALRERGTPVLDMIAKLLERFEGQLSIEGHTDDRPINSARFPSNWELSSARSTSVLRYLVDERRQKAVRMHVAGYADTRPLADNAKAEGRDQNRRVQFVFEHGPEFQGDPAAAYQLP